MQPRKVSTIACTPRGSTLAFVTLDKRLATAAQLEGFGVVAA